MTFLEALAAMKDGKKVRRSGWRAGEFVNSRIGIVCDENCHKYALEIEDFDAADWEVCE